MTSTGSPPLRPSRNPFLSALPSTSIFPVINVNQAPYNISGVLGTSLIAAIAAAPATGAVLDARGFTGAQSILATVTVNKPVQILLGAAAITCPSSGFAIDVQSSDASVIGAAGTLFTCTTGGAGAIRNLEAMRCRYRDFKINLNSVNGAYGFHHKGGWDIDVENLFVDKTSGNNNPFPKDATTNYGIVIESDAVGTYVGSYRNCTSLRTRIIGGVPQVTTMTFERLESDFIETSGGAIDLLFHMPITQADSSSFPHFDLAQVSGITLIGGDFEGSGTIYKIGASVNALVSIGNQVSVLSGKTMTYLDRSGNDVAQTCFFRDSYTLGAGATMTDPQDLVSMSGTKPVEALRNTGWPYYARLGMPWQGDRFERSLNIAATADLAGTLDNVSTGAVIDRMTTAAWQLLVAAAGANPRTLAKMIEVNTSQQLGFYGVVPVSRQLLATGVGHTVDDVISALQATGLLSQS